MGSHFVHINDRSRPKHVAKYNLIVIITSSIDICCVLTVHNTLYTVLAVDSVCFNVSFVFMSPYTFLFYFVFFFYLKRDVCFH